MSRKHQYTVQVSVGAPQLGAWGDGVTNGLENRPTGNGDSSSLSCPAKLSCSCVQPVV